MKKLLWFLRPTLIVLACYVAAVSLSYALSQQNVEDLDSSLTRVSQFADELGPIQQPSPQLSPEQVVEIQTAALGDSDEKRGVVQCMCFASPDNLAVTGPLEKFGRMVRGPRFAVLSAPKALQVGKAIYEGSNARVLVTAISNDDSIGAFVWVLTKQTTGEYADCWMTDGVFPLTESEGWADNEI